MKGWQRRCVTCARFHVCWNLFLKNVLEFWQTHNFIHVDVFGYTLFYWFECTPWYNRKSKHIFVHEASGHCCIPWLDFWKIFQYDGALGAHLTMKICELRPSNLYCCLKKIQNTKLFYALSMNFEIQLLSCWSCLLLLFKQYIVRKRKWYIGKKFIFSLKVKWYWVC